MFIKNTKNYYAAQWAVLESIELLLSVLRIGILSLKRFVADYNFLSYWAISTPSFGKIHFHLNEIVNAEDFTPIHPGGHHRRYSKGDVTPGVCATDFHLRSLYGAKISVLVIF